MPEMPEVEAFKEYVHKHALNKKIVEIISRAQSLIKNASLAALKKALIGKTFTSVLRQGKYVVISVSSGMKVVMHFGLTGSLAYVKDGEETVRFSRISFGFSKGSVLHWTDKRKFGGVWLVKDVDEIAVIKHLGKDPLKLTQAQWMGLLKEHATKNVKSLLMDQALLAGIGNEYSDEVLFRAAIDPRHAIEDLTQATRKKLFTSIKTVLRYAVKLRKTHVDQIDQCDFFSKKDRKNFPSSYLIAHRSVDNRCPRNENHTLVRSTIAGRTAYYCPKDQQ